MVGIKIASQLSSNGEIIMDCPDGIHINTNVLLSETGRRERNCDEDVTMEAEARVIQHEKDAICHS